MLDGGPNADTLEHVLHVDRCQRLVQLLRQFEAEVQNLRIFDYCFRPALWVWIAPKRPHSVTSIAFVRC